LKPGEEIAFTTPAVDIIQMVGKYMFSGGGKPAAEQGDGAGDDAGAAQPPSPTEIPQP
jgi:phospholipid/cholesterol/gamma-HCH transport system substrate-binding protein